MNGSCEINVRTGSLRDEYYVNKGDRLRLIVDLKIVNILTSLRFVETLKQEAVFESLRSLENVVRLKLPAYYRQDVEVVRFH